MGAALWGRRCGADGPFLRVSSFLGFTHPEGSSGFYRVFSFGGPGFFGVPAALP